MPQRVFICVNRGRCSVANAGRRLRLSVSRPHCPACGCVLDEIASKGNNRFFSNPWLVCGACASVLVLSASLFTSSVLKWTRGLSGARRGGAGFSGAERFFGETKQTALGSAILRDDPEAIRREIASGALVNGAGRFGVTPLLFALTHAKRHSFDTLLAAGGDPNRPTEKGDSVTSVCATLADSAFLKAALEHGGNVQFRDGRGRTPLILAALWQRPENVRLLLQHEADGRAQDDRGDDPLIASFQGVAPNVEAARLLIAAGVPTDRPNHAGLTAQDYAENFNDITVARLFQPTKPESP